jgi:hypothetical protein
MSLLHQIQESVVQENAELSSVLLKLRLLASRLGSDVLEEWVKHESEGYPVDADVPSYRIVGVSFRGTFSGPFGAGVNNAPIPTYLVAKHAGKQWTEYKIRESIAGVGELLKMSAKEGSLGIDASNLILLLQGKVYEDYACLEIKGTISRTAITEIQQSVRSKILELTLELEKSIPAASLVTFGVPKHTETNTEKIQQISQQIIYGNVTTAVAGSHGTQIAVEIGLRDSRSFIEHLVNAGIPEKDAGELAEILESEEPSSPEEPFGVNATKWLVSNLKKAVEGTWKVGISVATKILTDAALKYYGL